MKSQGNSAGAAGATHEPSSIQQLRNGVTGRGVRPIRAWAVLWGVPLALLGAVHAIPWSMVAWLILWTAPLDVFARVLSDVGKVREALADCAPYVPGLVPYLPQLLPPLIWNAPRIAPFVGELAPYLKDLMPYPAFIAKALPSLLRKIELMGPLIGQIGPLFCQMDERHFSKLELVVDDLVDQIEELLPYFHIIAPHLVEISLRADKLLPVVHYLLPHAEKMKDHIGWLIPFADIEGFEEFMPYLDKLAPYVDDFAPYGPQLLPKLPAMRQHVPILLNNAGALLPNLGGAVDHIDPLIWWFGDYLPFANKLGLLQYSLLVKAGVPFAKLLPNLPAGHSIMELELPPNRAPNSSEPPSFNEDLAAWRLKETRRIVTLPKVVVDKGVTYFVVNVDGRYAGEFRYSHLRELNDLCSLMLDEQEFARLPPFPGRGPHNTENRRKALESYLTYVFQDPKIVSARPFVSFIRARRRWSQPMPLMASPYLDPSRN